MNWKATLAAAFVMFAVVACNLPGAQPTAAPPTAPLPTETVEQAATAEPAETSTEPPAATDTAPPPATPAPTVEEPERVSFETGATSATRRLSRGRSRRAARMSISSTCWRGRR